MTFMWDSYGVAPVSCGLIGDCLKLLLFSTIPVESALVPNVFCNSLPENISVRSVRILYNLRNC